MSSMGGLLTAFLLATNLFGNFATIPMVGYMYSYNTVLHTEAYGIKIVYIVQGDSITVEDIEKTRAILETRLDAQLILNRKIEIDETAKVISVYFNSNNVNSDNITQFAEELSAKANLTFRDTDGNILLSGKDILHAVVEPIDVNGMEQYGVQIEFTKEGGELFSEITQKMIGKNLSIYMDDVLISNPVVQAPITGGKAVITGLATKEAAKSFAIIINGGVLPCDMQIESTSITTK